VPISLLISLPPLPAAWTIPMPRQPSEGQAFTLARDRLAAASPAAGVVPFQGPDPASTGRSPSGGASTDRPDAVAASAVGPAVDLGAQWYTPEGKVVGRPVGGAESTDRTPGPRLPPEGIEL
jgi:hypothetical protein